MAIYLEHVSGVDKDKVEVFETDRVRVGRNPDNDLRFDGDDARQVSRYHAEIYREGERHFVKDLQSRNGTFVGGRRIEQPVQLNEGDAMQFAAGGPTLRFSTQPVATTGARPGPSAAPDAPPAAPRPWRRTVLVLGAALAAAVVAGGVAGYLWSSWWVFLAGFAGAAAIESVGLFVWTWWKGRRAGSVAPATDGDVPGPTPAEALEELAHRWAEGVNILRASNLKQGSEGAIYALPWYLMLGERGSGHTSAVRSARPLPSSPGSRRQTGPTTTFDWWFFEQCVVLDVTGRYVSGEASDAREWRRFLDLLRRTRRRQPLNGVVVTLTADDMIRRPIERLQEQAGHIRRQLDEMVQELGIVFPVYVLATGLDAVPGFTRIFGRLPDGSVDQAMGAANAETDAQDAGAAAERAFRTIGGRLHALRLATLSETEGATAEDPSHVFLFVEEFKMLERPLRAFVEALFRRSPYHETPTFRGIYFSSAAQNRATASQLAPRMGLETRVVSGERASRAFFARHLFTQVLPAERGLVRPTAAWYRHYHGAQLAGILAAVAATLALILVFTLSFVRNSQALVTATVDVCRPRTAVPTPEVRLVQLDDCREAIESLSPQSRWARVSTDFGLRHTHVLQAAMRTRYVEAAKLDAIEPQEARIDAKLTAGAEAPPYVAALVDRVQLIGRCRAGDCATLDDWKSARYAAMIAADRPDLRETTIAMLARTQAAYLRWQPDVAALDQLRGADAARVARWIRTGGLRPEWFLASASARFPAVRMKDFWGVDGPSLVEGAYTARAWHDALAPLVTGLRAITNEQAEAAAALNTFETDYRRNGQRQWQAFLEAFPQGERLAAGRRADRDFAGWMVKPDSPYRRLLDAVVTNVTPLAPESQVDAPSWVRTVTRYAALRAKLAKLSPEEQKALKQREREAAANLTSYQEASEQLRAEMTPPERAYRSTLKVFDEGEPSARSTHPIQKALWAVRNLRGALPGSDAGDDGQFWLLFTRPIELTWRAILDQAGVHLQQQWEAVWPELAEQNTAPAQRAGRVIGFVNDKLAAVLDLKGNRYVARQMFGEGIPFRADFLDYLASARQFQPTGTAQLLPPRQIVSIF
jgi:type VI secretion system protein ImpL